ncbi:MAG: methyl-accepting chemotaxis protein [Carboxylicivirga sp.]|jgi:methyl-accepting chemotaxis protein|nr:methyl-accepting chemotaxis protein [Carboxylicivirga sp.]
MKNKKISNQITIIVMVISLTVLWAIMSVTTYRFYITTKEAAIDNVTQSLAKAGNKVYNFINDHMQRIVTISEILEIKEDEKFLISRDRNHVTHLLQKYLDSYDDVASTFIVYEDNLFDGQNDKYRNINFNDSTGGFHLLFKKNKVTTLDPNSFDLDYLQIPKHTLKPYVVDPYLYTTHNGKKELLVTITVPIIREGKFIGVVGADLNVSQFQNIVNEVQLYEGKAGIAIVDSKGIYVSHSTESHKLGKSITEFSSDSTMRLAKLKNGETDHYHDQGFVYLTHALQFADYISPWQMRLKVKRTVIYEKMIYELILTLLMTIALTTIGLFLLRRSIVHRMKPIEELNTSCKVIADGNLTNVIDIKANNEIGQLAHSFLKMVNHLKLFINAIQNGTENIRSATIQLQGSTEELSSSINRQASVTEEISCSMEEMNASVQQIGAHNIDVNKQMENFVTDMNTMGENAQTATDVSFDVSNNVSLTEDIAQQINILSLNAAVEAANAGKYGKGFAVVAREIRKLSDSTAQISKQITVKTSKNKELSIHANNKLKTLVESSLKISEITQNIADSIEEQMHGINQVTVGSQQLNSSAQTSAANAEEIASTVEELAQQADKLYDLTKTYIVD